MSKWGDGTEGEGEGERKRENIKQPPHSVQSLTQGLIPRPWDHDLSRNQELDAQPTEPPRHPSVNFYNPLNRIRNKF